MNRSFHDQTPAQSYRKIIIRDLVLLASIGIFPEEMKKAQRVNINISIYLPESPPFEVNSIEETLSYATIISGIKALIARGHIDLVERFVDDISKLCFEDGRVKRVKIEVLKIDVIPEAGGVGVAIDRWRNQCFPQ